MTDERIERVSKGHDGPCPGRAPTRGDCTCGHAAVAASLERELTELREALGDCWGEAYIGGLEGEGSTPIEALGLVIDIARRALHHDEVTRAETYVHPEGDDAADGKSWRTAKRTLGG